MLWIPLAAVSYFLSALSAVIDKILIRHRIPNPLAFAFYTGVASIGVFILAPFGFDWLSPFEYLLSISSGIVFLLALLFLYCGLRYGEASRVVPLVGALTPVFVLFLSYVFLGARLPAGEYYSILFFIAGGLAISFEPHRQGRSILDGFVLLFSLLAGLSMGAMFVLSKAVYSAAAFLPAFIWMRIGSFIGALLLLVIPSFRKSIFHSAKTTQLSSGGILLLNKIIGATAFFILNYSIAIGSESVVSAMRGVEFLFVFFIAYMLTTRAPKVLSESFDLKAKISKISGVILIGVGFFFLFFS